MMKYFNKLLYTNFFLIAAIYGCTPEQSQSTSSKANLVRLKDISIRLDSNTTPYTLCAQLIPNKHSNVEFLYILNEPNNSVQVYDLFNNKNLKNLSFLREGPQAVGKVNGFFLDSSQNMYVLNRDTRNIYQVSDQGKPIRNIKLDQENRINGLCPIPIIGDGIEVINNDNIIDIPGNPSLVHDVDSKAFFEKSFLDISINTKSKEIKYRINYPNKNLLIENNYPPQSIMTFRTHNKDKLIYSFGCDHRLFLYDNDGIFLKSHELKSKYAPESIATMPISIKYKNAEECYIYYVNNLYYSALHYDKYRNYYYRLVKKQAKQEYTKKDLISGKAVDQQWSIIVADEKFNNLGEIDLPSDVWGGLVLISEKGLLIQKALENEDNMVFSLFKPTIQ